MAKTRRDLDEFRRLAEIWGGDVERWPEAERDWAWEMAQTPAAAAVLAAEQRLDVWMTAPPPASEARAAGVAGQVMGKVAEAALQRRLDWSRAWVDQLVSSRVGRIQAAFAGLTAGAAFGVVLGILAPVGASVEQDIAMQLLSSGDFLPLGARIR